MPPIVTPRINTKETFAFQYGRIEIRAKLPKGDWIVGIIIKYPSYTKCFCYALLGTSSTTWTFDRVVRTIGLRIRAAACGFGQR